MIAHSTRRRAARQGDAVGDLAQDNLISHQFRLSIVIRVFVDLQFQNNLLVQSGKNGGCGESELSSIALWGGENALLQCQAAGLVDPAKIDRAAPSSNPRSARPLGSRSTKSIRLIFASCACRSTCGFRSMANPSGSRIEIGPTSTCCPDGALKLRETAYATPSVPHNTAHMTACISRYRRGVYSQGRGIESSIVTIPTRFRPESHANRVSKLRNRTGIMKR